MKQRNWTMSQKEITRLEVVNQYLAKAFNQAEAAEQLVMSERHFRRLLRAFAHSGAEGLISKRRGRPRFGEIIQIDGSQHDWFEGRGPRCTLIAFTDDATSLVSACFFYDAETTFNYMDCLQQHLTRLRRPLAIYSDRHSIFYNNKKELYNPQQASQFSRAPSNTLCFKPYDTTHSTAL